MNERACGVRLHPAARLLRWMGHHAVGVGFLLIGVWLFRAVLAGADGISYDWQWYRVWRYLGRWTDGHFIPGPLLDGLGMTVRIALSGLALAVLDDLALHRGALHHGSAEGGLLAVDDGQDLIELHGVAGFLVQLLNVDRVALGHLVLLAASHDDCVHCVVSTPSLRARCRGRSGRTLINPFKAAQLVYQRKTELSTFSGGKIQKKFTWQRN